MLPEPGFLGGPGAVFYVWLRLLLILYFTVKHVIFTGT